MILWVLSSDRCFRDQIAAELWRNFEIVEFVSLCHFKEKAAKEPSRPHAIVIGGDLKETVALQDKFCKSLNRLKITPEGEPVPCFIQAVEEVENKYAPCNVFVIFEKMPSDAVLKTLSNKTVNPITDQFQSERINRLIASLGFMEKAT